MNESCAPSTELSSSTTLGGTPPSTFFEAHIKTGPEAPGGQRIPLPRSEEELGECLNVREEDWFGGMWVGPNPHNCSKNYTKEALEKLCQCVKDLQITSTGVICVRLPQDFLTTVHGANALSFLLTETVGFEIWAVVPGEFIYRKWNGQGPCMFPPFATGLGGAGAVVLSPDEEQVALLENVNRPGFYDLPRGARDHGETLLETAVRETKEETGLERDLAAEAQSLCYHDIGEARDAKVLRIADTHAVYAFKVLGTDTQAQKSEVKKVVWSPIADLVFGYEKFTDSLDDKTSLPRSIKIGDNVINCSALFAIHRYAMGEGSPCTNIGGYTTW